MLSTTKPFIIKFFKSINASFWFIPLIMLFSVLVLAYTLSSIDLHFSKAVSQSMGLLKLDKINGGREILSTIASSMMTVAGVTFSMTLLSLSHASIQIGPRILSNFMKDKGNQVTLGVFISTYAYCLIIMGMIKDTDELAKSLFISIYMAYILALLSLVVLIYFINHVPNAINMTVAVSRVGSDFIKGTKKTDKSSIQNELDKKRFFTQTSNLIKTPVRVEGKGYIEKIDYQSILEISIKFDLYIKVKVSTGSFIHEFKSTSEVFSQYDLSEDVIKQISDCFIFGVSRTINQDTLFAAELLTEVAIRALSPGVNDPFTAKECIDQLEAGILNMAIYPDPKSIFKDSTGNTRVYIRTISFEKLVKRVFGQLRPYVAEDMVASRHLLKAFLSINREVSSPLQRAIIKLESQKMVDLALLNIKDKEYQGYIVDLNNKIQQD